MEGDSKRNRTADVKDLLLEDYKALSQSLSESEKIGETRFNWFIGIITAVAGGFVALATKKEPPITAEVLKSTALGSLVALLVFGVMTLSRIINRNRTTDGFKKDLARIRQIFRDRLDQERILNNYHPFKRPRRSRSSGGLASMVAAINSLLAGGIAAVILLLWPSTSMTRAVTVAVITAIGALAAQHFSLLRNHPWLTHAGGVVYRVKDGTKECLLVGPKKDRPGEWVLPKGHQERHEKIRDTALREVAEETGVQAEVTYPLRFIRFTRFKADNETIWARFYLMKLVSEREPCESKPRRQGWFSFKDGIERATHPQTVRSLKKAADRLGEPT